MTANASAASAGFDPSALKRWIAEGRLEQAAAHCREALARDPADLRVSVALADIELRQGRGGPAHEAVERSLREGAALSDVLGPGLPASIAAGDQALGGRLMQYFEQQSNDRRIELLRYWAGRLEDLYLFTQAAAMLRPLAERGDAESEVLIDYAQLLMKAHQAEAAAAVLERAVRLAPGHVGVHLARMRLNMQLGEFDAACSAAESALAIDAESIPALSMLSEIEPSRLPRDSVTVLERVLADEGADDERRAAAGLALGRRLELDAGRESEAFAAFERAKRCLKQRARRRGTAYRPERTEALLQARIQVFGQAPCVAGDEGAGLIFIVGMPRSGTTLLDRILAAHPQVRSVGENTVMPAIADAAEIDAGDPARFEELLQQHAGTWRARYLQSLPGAPDGGRFVVDKLPLNFWSVGLIAMLFPAARVLHALRDPRDIALSGFRLRFPDAFDYVDAFEDFAHYYAAHRRMMAHWRELWPELVRPVVYERVVADPRTEVARLLTHCGLPWAEECLRFADRSGPVYTLSMGQVRREFYRDAAGRWKRYEKQLAPLLEELRRNHVAIDAYDGRDD